MSLGILKRRHGRHWSLEQANSELHLQNLADSLINAPHRYPSRFDGTDHSLEVIVALHVHVDSSLDRTDERLG